MVSSLVLWVHVPYGFWVVLPCHIIVHIGLPYSYIIPAVLLHCALPLIFNLFHDIQPVVPWVYYGPICITFSYTLLFSSIYSSILVLVSSCVWPYFSIVPVYYYSIPSSYFVHFSSIQFYTTTLPLACLFYGSLLYTAYLVCLCHYDTFCMPWLVLPSFATPGLCTPILCSSTFILLILVPWL